MANLTLIHQLQDGDSEVKFCGLLLDIYLLGAYKLLLEIRKDFGLGARFSRCIYYFFVKIVKVYLFIREFLLTIAAHLEYLPEFF